MKMFLLPVFVLPILTQGHQNIMVSTGMTYVSKGAREIIRESEVINVNLSCSRSPAGYPKGLYGAVAMRHKSKMVICSGCCPMTSDCYSYSNNSWNKEAFKTSRFGATSVEVKPGEWFVIGGARGEFINTMKSLRGSMFFRNGSFHRGLYLPEPINGGSSVMLNETHVFLAAGYNDSGYSPKNYLLNVNTKKWTRIADRTFTPSSQHSSGTFMNSTAGEIQVANIGVFGIEVYSPKKNSWQQLSHMIKIYGAAMIQQESDSFMLIGGIAAKGAKPDDFSYSSHIYLFDENGLKILKENALQVARRNHVAMPIPEEDFNCE